MFLRMYANIFEGDRCRITCPVHPHYGEWVTFARLEYWSQAPVFIFENKGGARISAKCESQFRMLPYPGSLLDAIDLALQLRDAEWFGELTDLLRAAIDGERKNPGGNQS